MEQQYDSQPQFYLINNISLSPYYLEREVMTSMTSKYSETHRMTLPDPLEVTHKKIRPYITNLEVGPP